MTGSPPFPRWLLASALAFTLLFMAWPRLDLIANGVFYNAETGFLLRGHVVFDAVHQYLGVLTLSLLAWSATVWGLSMRHSRPEKWRARRPAALFLTLSLLLGPGLMVNVVFKDHWVAPAPLKSRNSMASAQFTPPWVISDQCRKNCSFVCGDASVGYTLLAIAFVSRHPRFWLVGGFAVGTVLGLMRMGQGGHFFSDVIFSFYVIYFTAWGLHRFMTRGGRTLHSLD